MGTTCIVLLIEKIDFNRGVSFLSAIPFLIFSIFSFVGKPDSKDVFTINGSLIILLALTWIFNISNDDNLFFTLKKLLGVYFVMLFGFVVILDCETLFCTNIFSICPIIIYCN